MQIPRQEYPRPQFVREKWINLNGQWQFEIDNGRSGEARGMHEEGYALKEEITVPFCPESELSGLGYKDFMFGVWYKRKVNLEKCEGRTVLHFGAVDYACKAFVNGEFVGEHKGGYVSFSFDITNAVREGENEITVFAMDDTRDRLIPSGKQSSKYESYGCHYTRTTGIWQTVWLEFTPKSYVKSVKYYPNITDCSVNIEATLCGDEDLLCEIFYEGKPMGSYRAKAVKGKHYFSVPLSEKHLWEVGNGRLYDVKLTYGEDKVDSYFGLREVCLDGFKFLINGKSVFQRLVLDQGFYPDGIYTAPSDEALVKDIELSLAAGFNGARLHEKIFEERFLYHADRLGYVVWGEYPDWGLDVSYEDNIYSFLPEWMEELERDFNHPAIVGWCPHNETTDKDFRKQFDPSISMVYDVTKAIDPTRPCIDSSGWFHVKTDIFCVHTYNHNTQTFKDNFDRLMREGYLFDHKEKRQTYKGEATFVSEYGGITYNANGKSWGYGAVENVEAFYEKFKGLTDPLIDNSKMFGLCYTQLTDVEQEQNGIYAYDRTPKFDVEPLRKIMSRKAAIED